MSPLDRCAMASTWLFTPGDRPDRFAKATHSGADAIILDLEDAVSVGAKESARGAVTAHLRSSTTPVWVRINALGTPWHDDDVAALAHAAADASADALSGVVVPKAEDPERIAEVAQRVGAGVPLVALVESALGAHRAVEIASAPGVRRLAFGSVDYALDIDAAETEQTLLAPRCALVAASRLAGLPAPVDGATLAVRDADRAESDARYARSLGFGGKLCIHPAQIAPVAAAFRPTAEEAAWAQDVLARAEAAGSGVCCDADGRMIDQPVILRARRLVAAST